MTERVLTTSPETPERRSADLDLPVLEVADDLVAALQRFGAAVLVAPPGTGKTTGVPPRLAEEPWADRRHRIVVVVPRRIAARAAASRMAQQRTERVGSRFGYSVRHDRRVSDATVVEVVTHGILLRRLQAEPDLPGVAAVLLDEFHERSIEGDLLLSLLVDVRESLREDLRLLVMSATLDAAPVATVLRARDSTVPGARSTDVPAPSAPVLRVEAPRHPVSTLWRPGSVHEPLEDRVAEVVIEALNDQEGDLLVFLPGRAEIGATVRRLRPRVGRATEVLELHASVSPEAQDAILAPGPAAGRRVILSTAIAETSVTVPGVRVVIDAGRRRFVEVDPGTGLPSLVTRAVSHAGADQRRGRAGREAPGVCYRLWSRTDDELRRRSDPPEITVGDLSTLLLQTVAWGASSPAELRWLDPPPEPALVRARSLLADLGAFDADGRLTPLGRTLADLGFHPRLAAIAAVGRDRGCPSLTAQVLAVLDAGRGGSADLCEAVRTVRSGTADATLRRTHAQWRRRLGASSSREPEPADLDREVARLVLSGYADRIARRRPGREGVYHLRHGGEVELPRAARGLGDAEWIAALEMDARAGTGRPGLLHLGVAVPDGELEQLLVRASTEGRINESTEVEWDPATTAVSTTTSRRLDAVVLDRRRRRDPDASALAAAVSSVVARDGPSVFSAWGDVAEVVARVAFLTATGVPRPSDPQGGWPDLSEEHLTATAALWVPTLASYGGRAGRFDPTADQITTALTAELSVADTTALGTHAPTHWQAPGRRPMRLRYGEVDGDPASVLLPTRLHDLFGIDDHPVLGPRRTPITVELLSPAGRPVQRTLDLPGFWRGSYAAVRRELRGRYRKHAWPEHPESWQPERDRR